MLNKNILLKSFFLVISMVFCGAFLICVNSCSSNIVYSKIKADGITDDTETLKKELLNLKEGQTLVTPSGTSRITNIHMPSFINNVTLDFTNTIFKVVDNFDISSGGPMFQFSLTNSTILGLNTDGNRDNIKDNKSQIGEMFNFRLNPKCENLTFKNTTINNTAYCGVSLGNDLNNISFINTTCSNIGEHIFYLPSGTNNFGNIRNFTIDGLTVTDLGINDINKSLNHEVSVLKAGTMGDNYARCENFTIKNVNIHQYNDKCYSAVILTGSNIDKINIENIYASFDNEKNNLEGIIYNAGGLCTDVSLNNIYNNSRIIYSYTNTTKFKNLSVNNYVCKGEYTPHINFVDTYTNCSFTNISTSPINESNNDIKFIDCTFNTSKNRITLSHINSNITFENCNFISNISSNYSIAQIELGNVTYKEDCFVKFNNCNCDSNNFSYFIRTFSKNTNLEINNSTINGSLISVAENKEINSLIMDTVTLNTSLDKFSQNYVVTNTERYTNITEN